MNHIKGVLFVAGGFIILVTLVSLLMPSQVMLSRTVMINSNTESIKKYIADLSEWKHWHPVFMERKDIVINKHDSTASTATWEDNGKANELIVTGADPHHVNLTLRRNSENDINSIFSIQHIRDSASVQVEWRMITKLKWYPWEKFSGIFIDKAMGPTCEAALKNLKGYVERGVTRGLKVQSSEFKVQWSQRVSYSRRCEP